MSNPNAKPNEAEQTENPNIDETAPTEKTENTGLGAIADTLTDSMPDVQEHAIEQEQAKNDKLREKWENTKDERGVTFDPNEHKTDKSGNPTLSPKGNFIKKPKPKNADAPKSKSFIGGRPEPEQAKQPDPNQQAKVQAAASGAMAANLMITLGMVAGGSEWQPLTNKESGLDEKAMLEQAFSDYFVATGKTDIPAGMALTVAIGAYALPRFTMPKTQTRLGKLKSWFVQKMADRKLKKYGLKTQETDAK